MQDRGRPYWITVEVTAPDRAEAREVAEGLAVLERVDRIVLVDRMPPESDRRREPIFGRNTEDW